MLKWKRKAYLPCLRTRAARNSLVWYHFLTSSLMTQNSAPSASRQHSEGQSLSPYCDVVVNIVSYQLTNTLQTPHSINTHNTKPFAYRPVGGPRMHGVRLGAALRCAALVPNELRDWV